MKLTTKALRIKHLCGSAPSQKFVEAQLRRADASLLIDADSLIHLDSGRRQPISGVEENKFSADAIAKAAADLLAAEADIKLVTLFLPFAQFIATPFSLPNIGQDNMIGVLQLQSSKLLPGVEQDMVVVANVSENAKGDYCDVALWLSARVIDSLFQSFDKAGLLLGCLLPRPLVFVNDLVEHLRIYDYGALNHLIVDWHDNAILGWNQVTSSDLESVPFREQWQQVKGNTEFRECLELTVPDELEKRLPFTPDIARHSYCFHPTQAVNSYTKTWRRKRKVIFTLLACLGVFLISLPLLKVSVQDVYAQKKLQQLQQRTSSLRKIKYRVNEFEAEWAVFNEFPVQDVNKILQTFEEILPANTWLTSFDMKNGFVEIEGYTSEPAVIFEIIEKNSLFSQVAFSKATSRRGGKVDKEYFAIRCRLAGVDVESYLTKYFSSK